MLNKTNLAVMKNCELGYKRLLIIKANKIIILNIYRNKKLSICKNYFFTFTLFTYIFKEANAIWYLRN